MNVPKKKHNCMLTPRAKELRKDMTSQERKLWFLFLRAYPIRFLRQRVIGNFIADFYCAKAKLIVEADGNQHFTEQGLAYDEERSRILGEHALTVLRFTNMEVDRQFSTVCAKIDEFIKAALQHGVSTKI